MSEEKIFPKLYASDIEQIDPANCGSTVGYRITGDSYSFDASLDLADCNRTINWSFNSKPESLDKIDKAINLLSQFRAALWKAQKEYKKDDAAYKSKKE